MDHWRSRHQPKVPHIIPSAIGGLRSAQVIDAKCIAYASVAPSMLLVVRLQVGVTGFENCCFRKSYLRNLVGGSDNSVIVKHFYLR